MCIRDSPAAPSSPFLVCGGRPEGRHPRPVRAVSATGEIQGADGQPHPAFYGKLPEEFSKADTMRFMAVSYTHLDVYKRQWTPSIGQAPEGWHEGSGFSSWRILEADVRRHTI